MGLVGAQLSFGEYVLEFFRTFVTDDVLAFRCKALEVSVRRLLLLVSSNIVLLAGCVSSDDSVRSFGAFILILLVL